MNNLDRNLWALPIGVPLVFLGLAINCGGVEAASEVVFVSVVCTAGLGLLFWLPICWVVGRLFLGLIFLFIKITPTDSANRRARERFE